MSRLVAGRTVGDQRALPAARKSQRSPNVGPVERWASALVGGALALDGLRRRTLGGLGLGALGAPLLYRAATGRCPVYRGLGIDTARTNAPGIGSDLDAVHVETIRVTHTIAVNRGAEEIFRFWRRLEMFARLGRALHARGADEWPVSTRVFSEPVPSEAEWEFEITAEKENESLTWRALRNDVFDHSGLLQLKPLPAGRGTSLRLSVGYASVGGRAGAAFARLLNRPSSQVTELLRRFKQWVETGEIATTCGQPRGD